MKYCSIDEENFNYFRPLLQEEQQRRMMSDPSVFGLGAYDGDTACGIALYTTDEEQQSLRIIYVAVSMSYQRRGVGRDMIKKLSKTAYDNGYIAISNFYAKDAEDPRYAMFDGTEDFTIEMLPGGVYEASSDKLKEVIFAIPSAEYDKKTKGSRVTFSQCGNQTKRLIYAAAADSGLEPSQLKAFVDEDLSYATIDESGEPQAFVIISHFKDRNMYEVSYAASTEPDQAADLFNILVYSITDISDSMEEGDVLRFSTPVGSVARLAEKYFKNDLRIENFYLAGYNGETIG